MHDPRNSPTRVHVPGGRASRVHRWQRWSRWPLSASDCCISAFVTTSCRNPTIRLVARTDAADRLTASDFRRHDTSQQREDALPSASPHRRHRRCRFQPATRYPRRASQKSPIKWQSCRPKAVSIDAHETVPRLAESAPQRRRPLRPHPPAEPVVRASAERPSVPKVAQTTTAPDASGTGCKSRRHRTEGYGRKAPATPKRRGDRKASRRTWLASVRCLLPIRLWRKAD